MLYRATFVLLAAGTLTAAATAQLLPVDEASKRPDFVSFRARLQRAVARRDATGLLAVVHPQIKNSFGDDDGLDRFRSIWRIDAADSEIWAELSTVLSLGGSFFDNDTFIAPYVFSRWPGKFEAFDHVAVIGSHVRVRSAARLDAPPLATLSFAILPLAEPPETADWTAVRIDGGRVGYIASQYARSPIDYRAIFRFDRQWQLVTFVAGD